MLPNQTMKLNSRIDMLPFKTNCPDVNILMSAGLVKSQFNPAKNVYANNKVCHLQQSYKQYVSWQYTFKN